jgi:uncharacterized protein
MFISFDLAKSDANRQKHGVPLTLATLIDWSCVLSAPDTRKDYGELREIGFAPIGRRLYCVVFTQRRRQFRIISLRRASNRETACYERTIQTHSQYAR